MLFLLLLSLSLYFAVLLVIARRSRQRVTLIIGENEAFFRGGRQSPGFLVGTGMIAASVSAVSLVSVPGWAGTTGMTYLQMCAGFTVGYLVVAFVLLPVFYRWRLTSIYSWLSVRFGRQTHRTGACFFIVSRLLGTAARLSIVCLVLLGFMGLSGVFPFILTATALLALIYLYTRQGGIFTIVRTDAFQTACLLAALLLTLAIAAGRLGTEGLATVGESDMLRIFDWEAGSRQNFWRLFLSGVFIVIVMTGLDQGMMQKMLTCRSLKEAQKSMCAYGACFLPLNALLLFLGVLLYTLCATQGIAVPAEGDTLLPILIGNGELGTLIVVPFSIGIVATAFSSTDSALTAVTTSVCIDLVRIEERKWNSERQQQLRHRIHLAVCLTVLLCLILFRLVNNTSVIDAVYIIASYTYGPLLGLYTFGLICRQPVRDRYVPLVCLTAPALCALLDYGSPLWWDYTFGYELLMLNGALTFVGLWALVTTEPLNTTPKNLKKLNISCPSSTSTTG